MPAKIRELITALGSCDLSGRFARLPPSYSQGALRRGNDSRSVSTCWTRAWRSGGSGDELPSRRIRSVSVFPLCRGRQLGRRVAAVCRPNGTESLRQLVRCSAQAQVTAYEVSAIEIIKPGRFSAIELERKRVLIEKPRPKEAGRIRKTGPKRIHAPAGLG